MSVQPEAPEVAEPVLLRDDADGIATLTLNRPASGNSLSHRLVHDLQAEFDRIADDETVRVVVIAASGRLFCTGHDLNESLATESGEAKRASNLVCNRMMQSIVESPKPVIAKVRGTATAAGCELVASCDLAIASTEARFATPGVNIGLWCLTPQVALSRAVGRKHAMQMLLTGKLIDAETAMRFGLINEAVPPEALDQTVAGLATVIAGKSPFAVALGKRSFYRQYDMDRAQAYDYVADQMVRAFQAEDTREGIAAFLEKRPPVWKGR